MDIKYTTDTKIEDNSRMFKLQKANFDKEVNTAVSIESSIYPYDYLLFFSVSTFQRETLYPAESRGAASLRTSSGQDSPEDP